MDVNVTKDTVIADILAVDTGVIPILLNAGMHCIGCPAAQAETLEEACFVHGLDVDPIVDEIKSYLEKNAADEEKADA